MATGTDLKQITKKRLKTVKVLLSVKDWDGAAYMMGFVLECALKAVICKTLHLVNYPEYTGKQKVDDYFMTHRFDLLLKVSGMENIFSDRGPSESWRNWSEFTVEYPGDWPAMRYDINRKWDETKVKKLYTNLVESQNGLLKEVKKRW